MRKVQGKGEISFRGREYLIGRGLQGQPVALRRSGEEVDTWDVYYCGQRLRRVSPQRGGDAGPGGETACGVVYPAGNCLL